MPSYRIAYTDRILEIAAAPSTGVVALGGAVAGYRTFASILVNGDTCPYFIEAVDTNGNPTGQWERGFGTFSTTPSLTRSTVVDGSSGTSAIVNFTTPVRVGIAPMSDTVSFHAQPGGRLTLSSTTPVADGPTAGIGTIYYLPYLHDRIVLWAGAGLQIVQFTSVSLNIASAVQGTGYDIFGYVSASGVLLLEMLAWTNTSPTGRATQLSYLNGFLCKATDASRRYLGSFYCAATGLTYDVANMGSASSGGRRHLWNMYNRVNRQTYMYDNSAPWTYAGAAWRVMRGQTAPLGGVDMFRGLAEDAVIATGTTNGTTPASAQYEFGIGVNSATPSIPSSIGGTWNGTGSTMSTSVTSALVLTPAAGYSYIVLCEFANSGTITFGSYGTPVLDVLLKS